MMKLFLFLTLIAVFPFVYSCGVEKQAESTPESSLLWRIEREDLKHTTYLYGTMHLIQKEYFYFPEKLEKLVKSSEVLVMELEGLPDYAAAMSMMLLPEGESIQDYFTEAEMELIYDFMEAEMGMTKEAFDFSFGRMKPFIILQLATAKQFEGDTESFELTLTSIAKENEIEIKGLETIAQQLGFFDQIPSKDFGSMIVKYFEEADSLAFQTKEMQRIYRKGDLDSLALFMTETAPELMEFEDILLTGRNKAWIQPIIDWIHQKPTFIAVGAAHLTGENGVIALLRKEGYTLTPIAF